MERNFDLLACTHHVQVPSTYPATHCKHRLSFSLPLFFLEDIQTLIKHTSFFDQEEIAKRITIEQGKTLPDAKGDVFRGLGK
jgi:hypothetical protein